MGGRSNPRAGARVGGGKSPRQTEERAKRDLKHTRLSTSPCGRRSNAFKVFAVRISPKFEVLKRRFNERCGDPEWLTVGVECSARTIWSDVVLITKKPYVHLAIRLGEVGPQREYSHSGPIPEIIPSIYIENSNR